MHGSLTYTPKVTYRAVYVPPQNHVIESLMRHEPVLVTLKNMTGRDFGYDQESWDKWWNTEGRLGNRLEPGDQAPSSSDSKESDSQKRLGSKQHND